jgi:hypothetical protein
MYDCDDDCDDDCNDDCDDDDGAGDAGVVFLLLLRFSLWRQNDVLLVLPSAMHVLRVAGTHARGGRRQTPSASRLACPCSPSHLLANHPTMK